MVLFRTYEAGGKRGKGSSGLFLLCNLHPLCNDRVSLVCTVHTWLIRIKLGKRQLDQKNLLDPDQISIESPQTELYRETYLYAE